MSVSSGIKSTYDIQDTHMAPFQSIILMMEEMILESESIVFDKALSNPSFVYRNYQHNNSTLTDTTKPTCQKYKLSNTK